FIVTAFLFVISFIGIPLLLFWFLGVGQYYTRRYYNGLMCQLTERHLEFKKGVLFKVEKTIPLENIQDLTFVDNPILQWLDLRILKIETAGHSNAQGADMKLIGIVDTQNFKDKVLDQRERLKNGQAGMMGSKHSSSENSELMDVLHEIKGLLQDIKNKN
ncbi:MAG: PH domain-containing protein, partial [Bacteroidota bacterium]